MEVEDDVFELAKDYDLHFTSDMHPMHMHLVNLQCYKEAPINAEKYNIDWQLLNGAAPPYKSAPIIMNQTPYFTGPWVNLDGVHRVWRGMVNIRRIL